MGFVKLVVVLLLCIAGVVSDAPLQPELTSGSGIMVSGSGSGIPLTPEPEETTTTTSVSSTSTAIPTSSAATTSPSEAPPTTKSTSPVLIELTFGGPTEETFRSKGLQEELISLLIDLLQLDVEPQLTIREQDASIVVLIDLGTNQQETESYAMILLTSTDRQWLTFRNANNLTEVKVVTIEGDSSIPWWHWLIVAILGANVMGAVILLIVACCCRYCCKQRSKKMRGSSRVPQRHGPEMELKETLQQQAQFRRMQVRKVSQISLQARMDHAYYHSHLLSLKELERLVANPSPIFSEFVTVPPNLVTVAEVPSGAEDKNRYNNVLPNMATRVALFLKFGVPNSDYINANYIRGYKNASKSYIATQGPLQWTVSDFWRMVWEQQSSTIVMVTNLEERGISKCVRYWPEEERSHRITYDDLEIILRRRTTQRHFTITTFLLRHKNKMVSREVVHFWFTGWPDHGVPASCQAFLEFLLIIRKHIGDMPGPTIVHCSAGIGRTGVVIGADIGLQQVDQSNEVDVLKILSSLRRDRGGMIQTKEQYYFLHQVLLEYSRQKVNQATFQVNPRDLTLTEESETDLDTAALIN